MKRRFNSFQAHWLAQKTRWKKHIQATFVLTTYAMFVMVGGCEWKPFGSDDGKQKDERSVSEKGECTDKLSACRHKCYQADRGSSCRDCCTENARACDMDNSYSFSSCLDL